MTAAEARAMEALDRYVKKNNVGYTLRHKNYKRDKEGAPEGMVFDPSQLVDIHASTIIIVKDIADKLTQRWPGFRWAIQPNEKGRVFNIFCLDFHNVWGYVIRYDDIMNDPKRKEAFKAGRELLRRFRYEGERFDPVQVAAMPRTRQGQCIPDVSDLKATRFTKQARLQHLIATGKATVVMQDGKGQVIQTTEKV
jgi:hypothetical protein